DSLVGGKYRFQDANVTPGQTYYYQLEDVETGGATTRHGPIVITAPAASSGVEPGLVIALGLGVLAALSVGAFLVRKPIRGLKKPPAQ
ncbi:MAG: hypothetical protein HY782_07645, partial [Chloroflexi bacterium]|nr:hypothetical protein [Chloroflexota bacterium]